VVSSARLAIAVYTVTPILIASYTYPAEGVGWLEGGQL
jgi:hypothetical protein